MAKFTPSDLTIIRASSSSSCLRCLGVDLTIGEIGGSLVLRPALGGGMTILCDECIQTVKDTIKKAEGRDD